MVRLNVAFNDRLEDSEMITASCKFMFVVFCLFNSCKNSTDDVFYNELHFYEKVQINVSMQFHASLKNYSSY